MLPLSPGRAESHGFEYKRNGTLSLFAALNTGTGEVLRAAKKTCHRTATQLQLRGHEEKRQKSPKPCGSASGHCCRWCGHRPREVVHDSVTSAPSTASCSYCALASPGTILHLELGFGSVDELVGARHPARLSSPRVHGFSSIKDLVGKKLMRYIAGQYNKNSQTSVRWKFSRSELPGGSPLQAEIPLFQWTSWEARSLTLITQRQAIAHDRLAGQRRSIAPRSPSASKHGRSTRIACALQGRHRRRCEAPPRARLRAGRVQSAGQRRLAAQPSR